MDAAEIVEPLCNPRVLREPLRFEGLRSFSCGRQGKPWESMVNKWVKDLYRGTERDQTVVVLEDASGRLVGICSLKPQALVVDEFVGKDAQRIHMLAIDRRYHGAHLSDGRRLSDTLLRAALDQIRIECSGSTPCVSALIAPENDRSQALFDRHGFGRIPYAGLGAVIRIRLPARRLSLRRLKLSKMMS